HWQIQSEESNPGCRIFTTRAAKAWATTGPARTDMPPCPLSPNTKGRSSRSCPCPFNRSARRAASAPPALLYLLADLGVDRGDGGHVEDAARGGAGGEDVHRLADAHQDRADGDAVGEHSHQVVGDVRGFQVRHHEQVGAALEGAVGHDLAAQDLVPRGVALHLAVHVQARAAPAQELAYLAHLHRVLRLVAAEVGVRQQGHVRLDAEQAHAERGLQGGLGDLLGGRIVLDVGVYEEEHALLVDHTGHGRGGLHPRLQRYHAAHVAELFVEAADDAGQQRVGLAPGDHHRANQGGARAHQGLGHGHGDATTLGQGVVVLPVVVEARVVVLVGDLEVHAGLHAQAQALDAALDHLGAADQDREGELLVDHGLYRAQHHFL